MTAAMQHGLQATVWRYFRRARGLMVVIAIFVAPAAQNPLYEVMRNYLRN